MKRLDLDYVRRRPRWPGWLLLAVGLFVGADVLVGYLEIKDAMTGLQRPSRTAAQADRAASGPVSEQTQKELDAARRILVELTLPWERLFRSIETASGEHVALLSVEPDAQKEALKITGEARDYLEILNLIVRLEEGKAVSGVHLVNHAIRDNDPQRPYSFTLAANWRMVP